MRRRTDSSKPLEEDREEIEENILVKLIKSIISYITSHIINLTQLEYFDIIIYLEFDLSLIIYYLTYLTFLVNLFNQYFELTFLINFFN